MGRTDATLIRNGIRQALVCLLFALLVSACDTIESTGSDLYQTADVSLMPTPVTMPTASPVRPQPFRTDGGPLRIPPWIPVERAAPSTVQAGDLTTVVMTFTLYSDVSDTATLRLQISERTFNKYRFVPPQVSDPSANGYLTASVNNAPLALAPDPLKEGAFIVTMPPGGLRQGTVVTVTLGDRTGGSRGISVRKSRALDKFFLLYQTGSEDTGGSDGYLVDRNSRIVAASALDILGGPIDHLRAYAPSLVRPDVPFTVFVRPEDVHDNLSTEPVTAATVYDGLTEVSGAGEAVPGSSGYRITVTLPAEGVYRLRVAAAGRETVTNPLICSATQAYGVYWGVLHGHSELSDGSGSIDHYFSQMRDEAGLDFSAASDHDHDHLTDEMWPLLTGAAKEWNEPGRFVTFLGYEWARWRKNGDGDRNVYYPEDDRPLFRAGDPLYSTPPDLFRALRTERSAMVIPHHTAHAGNFCDWKDHDPKLERLVEIFQLRGSYECSAADGNPFPPIEATVSGGFVRDALAQGWRIGFAAGGDDHNGTAGTEIRFGTYRAGLMSVQAADLTRQAIWDGMWQRRVVATTGSRMLLSYDVNGFGMGSEVPLSSDPGLAATRRIHVEYHGTAPVQQVDIIRNGTVILSLPGQGGPDLDTVWDDTEPLPLLGPARYSPGPFCYYYIRVLQTDGEGAWASPVWILADE